MMSRFMCDAPLCSTNLSGHINCFALTCSQEASRALASSADGCIPLLIPGLPVVHCTLSAAFVGLSVAHFVGRPNRPFYVNFRASGTKITIQITEVSDATAHSMSGRRSVPLCEAFRCVIAHCRFRYRFAYCSSTIIKTR